jgi:hypothetical protein
VTSAAQNTRTQPERNRKVEMKMKSPPIVSPHEWETARQQLLV